MRFLSVCFEVSVTFTFCNMVPSPVGIHRLKINNKNTRTGYEINLKLTIKTPERHHTPERRQWRRSGVFIVNFEHISHFLLVFLLNL